MFEVLYYPLSDERDCDISTAIETISFYIDSLHKNNPNSKMLVHCSAGISRSASVLIGYCIIYKNLNLLNAFKFIKNIRKQIGPRPSFIKQLIKMEMKILKIDKSSMNLREYTIDLLHEDTQREKEQIGKILDECNRDYIKARNQIFALIQ